MFGYTDNQPLRSVHPEIKSCCPRWPRNLALGAAQPSLNRRPHPRRGGLPAFRNSWHDLLAARQRAIARLPAAFGLASQRRHGLAA